MGEQRSAASVVFIDGTWVLEQRYDTLPGDAPFELRIRDAGGATVASVAGTWDLTLASPRLRDFDPDGGTGAPVQNIGSAFVPAQRGVVGRLIEAAFEEVGQADSEADNAPGRMVLFGTGPELTGDATGGAEGARDPVAEPVAETARAPAATEGFLPQDVGARLIDVGIQVILPLLVLGVMVVVVAGKFARRT
jgi:hypothetical protein